MTRLQLDTNILNVNGDVIRHGYYVEDDKAKNGTTYVTDNLTIRAALIEALLLKVQTDKFTDLIYRKHLIDGLRDAEGEYSILEKDLEFINFAIIVKYELYLAAQVLEMIN